MHEAGLIVLIAFMFLALAGSFLSELLATRMVQTMAITHSTSPPGTAGSSASITVRYIELLAEGRGKRGTAAALGIRPTAESWYARQARRALGVRDCTRAGLSSEVSKRACVAPTVPPSKASPAAAT